MKKFAKVTLSIAGCIFTLGLVLIVVGGLSGGFDKTMEWIRSGELSFGNVGFGSLFNFGSDIDINNNYDVYSGKGSHEGIASADEFSNLEIVIGGGEVKVVREDVEAVNVSYKNAGKIQFYVENGTLVLVESYERFGSFKGSDIILTLPEGTELDNVTLSLGGGLATFDSINAQKLDVEVGAGKVVLKDIEVNSAELEIGAGKISVERGAVTDLDVNVGMGSFQYEGIINGELNAECSMGQMVYELAGTVDEHNYNVECAMGNIELDGRSYSGIASEKVIDNNSRSTFNLDCSMGNITVSFEN